MGGETATSAADVIKQEGKMEIRDMAKGKTHGSNGLPTESYSAYTVVLVPWLPEMFNTALVEQTLPHTTHEAILFLLFKTRRDTADVSSYRPLLMHNSDYNMLSKILATRIRHLMPHMF